MKSLIREVLLPGAAAVGLLVMMVIGPAGARDEPAGVEQRCERVDRIGEFTITRCD